MSGLLVQNYLGDEIKEFEFEPKDPWEKILLALAAVILIWMMIV